MFHAITWFVVSGLVAVWSLGAWAVHALAGWAITNAGVLAGTAPTGIPRLPEWLAPWIPPELAQGLASMLSAFTPVIEGLVQWAPSVGGGLSVAIWAVWALGSALLVALGLAVSGVIAVVRRRAVGPSISASAA